VRGDEHDRGRVRTVTHERGDREPCRARHLDVEEDDIRFRLAHELDRSAGTRRLTDHLDVGVLGKQVAQLIARRRLVVDHQRANHVAGTSMRTTVPNGNERSCTPSP
jgi:hypothetical protein